MRHRPNQSTMKRQVQENEQSGEVNEVIRGSTLYGNRIFYLFVLLAAVAPSWVTSPSEVPLAAEVAVSSVSCGCSIIHVARVFTPCDVTSH